MMAVSGTRAAIEWRGAEAVAAAFAGTSAGSAGVTPAVRVLRGALPDAKLLLLWPEDVGIAASLRALADGTIRYPAEGAPSPDVAEAVDRLRAHAPFGVIVFTAAAWSASTPAYVAYLAGIERRVGIAAEFAGAVLSHPIAPPEVPLADEERHLLLLHAAGIGRGRTRVVPLPDAGGAAAQALAAGSR